MEISRDKEQVSAGASGPCDSLPNDSSSGGPDSAVSGLTGKSPPAATVDPLAHLTTETPNPASYRLDHASALEIVQIINAEDAKVPAAVAAVADQIAKAIEMIASRMQRGGRLIYVGAGTSGRLGVLDAAECPPTFNTQPEQVIGVIAGGPQALTRAVEGAEDRAEDGARDLENLQVGACDSVVGIATSGRTPYVLGALRFARQAGAATIGLACNEDAQLRQLCDLFIAPIVGPEVLAGSTRMKAGTATKLVLNTISTGVMVLLGKTYGNLMVDLRATNTKLIARARRIVCQLTGLHPQAAEALLQQCDGEVKTAVLVHRGSLTIHEARRLLACHQGQLRAALRACGQDSPCGDAQ